MSYILGVNAGANTFHDASACLIDDAGRVLAFIEQERLTRDRHAPKDHTPAEAVARVLTLAGVDVDQLDTVAVGWDEPRVAARAATPWRFDSPGEFLRELGLASSRGPGRGPDLCFVPHHRAHAASAFYASPYEHAAVVVVDGSGEDESVSIFSADRGRPLVRLAAWPQVVSLGHFYEGVSRWLGLGKYGAGKVMGLAAYGHAGPSGWVTAVDADQRTELTSAIGDDSRWVYEDVITRWAKLLAAHGGTDRPATAPFELAGDPVAVQIAAAAQATVESVVTALVDRARADTSRGPVCLAGGVALNCAANGRLPGEVYVPPMPHDAGVALGAAWSLQPPREPAAFAPYTGGTPGPLPDGHAALDGARVENADVDAVVELLLAGQVVGVVRGRSEVGPRALCHRSLLASPTRVAMRETVNRLKRREPWRPFGPVALASDNGDHGLWEPIGHLERYMVGAAPVTERGAREIPAVRHVDGTTRPQRLGVGDEPFVEAVLAGLARAGHPPVLINTSFNGPGEPLVETAEQAVTCARQLGVPVCVVDETVIRFPAAASE